MRQARPVGAAASRAPGKAAGTAAILAALALAGCGTTAGPLDDTSATKAERALGRKGDSWLSLGQRLLETGEHQLALKAFERAILIDGPTAPAMTGAGLAAENLGLVTMAARYFRRARDLAPESVTTQNNLGVVLYRLEEYYPARQAFQTAFALSDGRNDLALRNLQLTERAIAEIESHQTYVDPAVNYDVRRLGSMEFELVSLDPLPDEVLEVEAQPIPGDITAIPELDPGSPFAVRPAPVPAGVAASPVAASPMTAAAAPVPATAGLATAAPSPGPSSATPGVEDGALAGWLADPAAAVEPIGFGTVAPAAGPPATAAAPERGAARGPVSDRSGTVEAPEGEAWQGVTAPRAAAAAEAEPTE